MMEGLSYPRSDANACSIRLVIPVRPQADHAATIVLTHKADPPIFTPQKASSYYLTFPDKDDLLWGGDIVASFPIVAGG